LPACFGGFGFLAEEEEIVLDLTCQVLYHYNKNGGLC